MTNGRIEGKEGIAVYLGLGSNLGDREANLREAVARIRKLGIEVRRESSIYETEPVGLREQPWFLNQVIELGALGPMLSKVKPPVGQGATTSSRLAKALLFELLKIENEMGRLRPIADGPRVIDIDLLLFGDMIIAHSKEEDRMGICVPHPRMHLRRFVLEPLCEIAPELMHPVLKKTCCELLAELDDDLRVRMYEQGS